MLCCQLKYIKLIIQQYQTFQLRTYGKLSWQANSGKLLLDEKKSERNGRQYYILKYYLSESKIYLDSKMKTLGSSSERDVFKNKGG